MRSNEHDVLFCDIDPEWESDFILQFLSKDRLKSKKELEYFTKYNSILSAYNEKKRIISMYEHIISKYEDRIKQVNKDDEEDKDNITKACIRSICSYQNKVDEESAYLQTYENELARLENTKTIRGIVDREGNTSIVEMVFAKTTLARDVGIVKKQSAVAKLMCRIKKWLSTLLT